MKIKEYNTFSRFLYFNNKVENIITNLMKQNEFDLNLLNKLASIDIINIVYSL